MLYVVYGCKFYSPEECDPYGRMDLLGEPDVFETLEEAVDCSVTRSQLCETKLAIIIEVPDKFRPRVVAWYGLRPAMYGIDFPGNREQCIRLMEDVKERLENSTYVPNTGGRW